MQTAAALPYIYPDAIPVPRQGDGGPCEQDRIGQTWLCQISLASQPMMGPRHVELGVFHACTLPDSLGASLDAAPAAM